MRTSYLRYGKATNSSSTHSVVLLPKDEDKKHFIKYGSRCHSDFGWEFFTLSTEVNKANYIYNQLYASNKEIAEKFKEEFSFDIQESYIDHQSLWGNYLFSNTCFFDFLISIAKDDQFIIVGGNDNEDYPNKKWEELLDNNIIQNVFTKNWSNFVRSGRGFRFFNRFALELEPAVLEVEIASLPKVEDHLSLCDIKITDYCPFGCSFCYQGSTKKGKHASLDDINIIANLLGEQKTFEVAIGGGEPTLHPDFDSIVNIFNDKDILPNVTTKNYEWLASNTFEKMIDWGCGIGISVSSYDDVVKAWEILNRSNHKFYGNCCFHIVEGDFPPDDLVKLIMGDYCVDNENHSYRPLGILVLGRKKTNRGKKSLFNLKADEIALKQKEVIIKLYSGDFSDKVCALSVDTPFAIENKDMLDLMGVSNVLYQTEEGKNSMYIDAVANTASLSSYDENSKKIKINKKSKLNEIHLELKKDNII